MHTRTPLDVSLRKTCKWRDLRDVMRDARDYRLVLHTLGAVDQSIHLWGYLYRKTITAIQSN